MKRENEYKKFPITLRVSRVSSNREDDFMAIQIDDQASGVRICDVKLSIEQFGVVLSGMTAIGEIDIGLNLPLGMTKEIKTEKVKLPSMATAEQKRAAVAKFEVDGWIGNDRDAGNHHRAHKREGKYETYVVTYHRYVPDKWANSRKTDRDK